MAGEWFSLGRSKILNTVRPHPELHAAMSATLRNLPVKKGGVIADRDWKVGDNKTWTIKLEEQNFEYITQKIPYWSGGKLNKSKKIYTITIPHTPKHIKIAWRKSSKIAASKAATPEQEKGSAFIFRRALNENAGWDSWGDIVEDQKTYPQLVKIWGGEVDQVWLKSYFAQSKVFLKRFKGHRFSEFDHSGTRSFMQYITGKVKRKFRISKKDTWNPADIWCITGSSSQLAREIDNQLEGPGQTIHELNSFLRKKFHDKEIVGVSLKKTGVTAEWEEVNVDGIVIDTKDYNYPVTPENFSSNFTIKTDTGSFVQDVKLNVSAPDGKDFSFQIKANSPEKSGGGNLKFEGTMKSASSARLGKAPVEMLEKILKSMKSYKDGDKGFTNNFRNKMYPKDREDFMENSDKWKKKIDHLITKGMVTDVSDLDKIIKSISDSYQSKADKGTNTRCKLMGLQFFYCLSYLTNPDLREFVTDMVFIAQKKASVKADEFGPFGKIY